MPLEKQTFTIEAAHICGPNNWTDEMCITFDNGEHDSNETIVTEILDLLNVNNFRDCLFRLKGGK